MSDVQEMKPDPAFLNAAISELQVQPADSVMIGDSTSDIEAAYRAETASIGYANKPGNTDRLHSAGADLVIDHMNSLIA